MSRLVTFWNQIHKLKSLYEKRGIAFLNEIDSTPEFKDFYQTLKLLRTEDFNFKQDISSYFGQETRYINFISEPNLGLGIFLFPVGGNFPIHDHPDAFVGTKILKGKLSVQPYDVLEGEKQSEIQKICKNENISQDHIASRLDPIVQVNKKDRLIIPVGGVNYLTPKKENAHRVEAIEEPCAMLDVFIPNPNFRVVYEEVDGKLKFVKKYEIIKALNSLEFNDITTTPLSM